MKKKNIKKLKKVEEEFVSFGNKKNVFWTITIATIVLSIIGIPIMVRYEEFLVRFLIIWILEIIYTAMYVKGKPKEK